MRRILVVILLTMFGVSAVAQVSTIKKSLICLCGCSMTVEACEGAMTCTTASKITATVERMVAEGKTNEEVLAAFVEMYGEKVLAAPTKKGFNLAAWILPFLLTSAGAAGLYFWISRRTAGRRRQDAATQGPRRPSAEVSRYEELLNKELEKLDL